jgi:anti-anti-sigma factor
MEISLQKDDDLCIVALKGKGAYEDRTKLRDYLDLLLENDALLLVVDLTAAEFVPASLLGVLTQKGDEFVQRGGRIMFVVDEARAFSPLVSVDHLKRFFQTAATVEEASRLIRVEAVEKESLRALIRRARPTPPPMTDPPPESP